MGSSHSETVSYKTCSNKEGKAQGSKAKLGGLWFGGKC